MSDPIIHVHKDWSGTLPDECPYCGELTELRRDKARLDWVLEQSEGWRIIPHPDGYELSLWRELSEPKMKWETDKSFVLLENDWKVIGVYDTRREAIDAAMEAEDGHIV